MDMDIKNIEIKGEFITLGQLIKVLDLVVSGGETKAFLLNSQILVNGEKEARRGKKLYKGDSIVINNKEYKIC